MNKIEILGVMIDSISFEEATRTVEGFLADGKKHYIVTPNPEQIILAQKNSRFKKILNEADLAVPDGIGVVWGSRILGQKLPERVSGVDLLEKLCQKAAQADWKVGLLGGRGLVAVQAGQELKKRFKGLKIIFAAAGNPSPVYDQKIRKTLPELVLLFVAYGAPKQEEWIKRNRDKIRVKVVMAVGGALEIFAGRQRRAPKVVRKVGLEWFWRLIWQPWRVRRQLALVEFASRVWLAKMKELKVWVVPH